MCIYNEIKNDNISIEKIGKIKNDSNEITTGNPKHKSKDQ